MDIENNKDNFYTYSLPKAVRILINLFRIFYLHKMKQTQIKISL